jgi:hydroxyethylthiazole kinase-like uncharacterized protein yjeF
MRYAFFVEDVRDAEVAALACGVATNALMEQAARGVATLAIRLLQDSAGLVVGTRILLLIGSGNNGGDALFAGAYLAERGAKVSALLLSPATHAGGLVALQKTGSQIFSSLREINFDEMDLVIDGIVGIGGKGGLTGIAAQVVAAISEDSIVVSVDLPSGIDADSGQAPGAHVNADVTAACGALKVAHLVDPGAAASGVCEVVELGLDFSQVASRVEVWQTNDVRDSLPHLRENTDKYARGVLGVIAGSKEFPGAGALVCASALATGVGMIRYLGQASETVIGDHPEVVRSIGRVQAWVIGPGLVDVSITEEIATAFASEQPIIVDAGALQVLPRGRVNTLITPHAGELSSLLGVERHEIESRNFFYATLAAKRFGVTVLLKGSTTIIASPTGRIAVNPTGTPKLATAGSGDVLAGLIGALAATGLPLFEAATVGAWLHGLAGWIMRGSGASDIAATIHEAIASVQWEVDEL